MTRIRTRLRRYFPLLGLVSAVCLMAVAALATAPNNAVLEQKIAAGLNANPTLSTTTTLTIASTSWTEFPATDVISTSGRDDLIQSLVITNFDASARICVTTTLRADSNCGDDTAPTATCSGASGDGEIVLAGQSREFRYNGTRCLWWASSAADGDGQAALVVR